MRTTKAAATDVASGENPPPVFYDALFRDVKERVVAPPVFPAGVRFADTHAHLDMFHHPELALARCAIHHVDYVITVIDPTEDPAYTLDNLDTWLAEAAGLAQDFTRARTSPSFSSADDFFVVVRIIAGCHPHNASRYSEEVEQTLREVLKDPRMRGVGEIGLDYHYDFSPRETQQNVYRRQLMLAHELNLPVALHMREAHADGLRILQETGVPPAGTLLHCFNLDYATLEPFLELGCYVAFGGPLTFKKSDEVRDAARRTPLDRIVTETDAPFMAPHPIRGVTCGPEHVVFTAACLAEVLSQSNLNAADVSATTSATTTSATTAPTAALYDRLFCNTLEFFERD